MSTQTVHQKNSLTDEQMDNLSIIATEALIEILLSTTAEFEEDVFYKMSFDFKFKTNDKRKIIGALYKNLKLRRK